MRFKKRYIIFLIIIGLIVFGTVIAFTRPALPTIQLPGEVYPGTEGIPFIPGITNTFVAALVAWLVVLLIGISLRARSRTADEVPTGFYNFFEALVEGLGNFTVNLAGSKKAKDFFPYFITILLYVLVANWMALVPGIDSIGFFEYLPHKEAIVEVSALERTYEDETGETLFETEHEREEAIHEVEHKVDELNVGNFKDGIFLLRAPDNAEEGNVEGPESRAGLDPENADWTLVPFLRAAGTDINFTLALSLVAMFMVQYFGFKYLGRRYLSKFFTFNIDKMSKNPIKMMDPAVGLLELIGEISRIISFTFRLLGNIFAGQVLLFVIAFLIPVANLVFFGLEFFVGLIQAAVFGLLAVIFMAGATESHDDHEEH